MISKRTLLSLNYTKSFVKRNYTKISFFSDFSNQYSIDLKVIEIMKVKMAQRKGLERKDFQECINRLEIKLALLFEENEKAFYANHTLIKKTNYN